MGHQLKQTPVRAGRLVALIALAASLVGLAASAGPALAAVAASPAAASVSAGPTYAIDLCCSLCPKAADPASYDGSSYLDEFRVLQQGRDGWLYRSGIDLTTDIEITDASIAQLRRLVTALHARGSELVIVFQPPRGLMDPQGLTPAARAHYDLAAARQSYAHALERIRLSGARVAPLDQLVDEHKDYEYFFRRDHHWTPDGAQHTAAVVAETVRSLPVYQDIPRKTFETHEASLIGKPGTLQKVASQICGGSYSMQYVTGYVTEPAGGSDANALLGDAGATPVGEDATGGGLLDPSAAASSDDAEGLLGNGAGGDDGNVPQIVMIGTSNSDTKGGYNFVGYLEQELSSDILDSALSGGSFDGSLLHYLPSDLYQKHPPKVIVWEIPWQNWPGANKNPYKTYRQAVPLVYDGCEGRNAVMAQTIDLHSGSNELLFNGGGAVRPLAGGNYWLDVQFDDPTVKDMHAVVWYFSGQKESLKMHFNQYVDNGGRFVTEFRNNRPDYAKATFMGATLELEQPPTRPLKATAKICRAEGSQQTAALEDPPHAHDHD